MPRIRVRPDRLRDLSKRLSQAAGDVAAITRSVSGAAGSLDWQVRQQGAVESATHEALAKGHRLAEHLTAMSRYLTLKYQALEAADNAEQASAKSPARSLLQRMMDAWRRSVGQVKQELQLLLGLGRVIAPTALPLPVLDGLDWLRRRLPDLFRRAPSGEEKAPPPDAGTRPEQPGTRTEPPATRPDEPAPADTRPATPTPATHANIEIQYDEHGPHPVPGTTNPDIGVEVDAPIQNVPGDRSVDAYNRVLDQFGVYYNPRYAQKGEYTFCNVFVRDATRAMGVEIPPDTAEGMTRWLRQKGPAAGWREVSAQEAQAMANQGKPAVAAYAGSPNESGHVAMVRPRMSEKDPPVVLAQAGASNENSCALETGVGPPGKREVHFFVHD